MMKKWISLVLIIIFTSLSLGSCTIKSTKTMESAKPIRIGLMADFTSLPFFVAQEKGLFHKAGVKLEFIMFKSAIERNSALQAGQIDGCNADIVAAISHIQAGYDVKIAFAAENQFALITSAPEVKSLSDLAGKDIGISKSTVIEYVLDTIMEKEGLAGKYHTIDIPKMPIRLQMLQEKKLTAACMPEPFVTIALNSGAAYLSDNTKYDLQPDLFMFYTKSLNKNKSAYQKMLVALNTAVIGINQAPDTFRPLLSDKISFPKDTAQGIKIPQFKAYSLTRELDIIGVMNWMDKKGMLKKQLSYDDIVFKGLIQ